MQINKKVTVHFKDAVSGLYQRTLYSLEEYPNGIIFEVDYVQPGTTKRFFVPYENITYIEFGA